MSTIFKQYRGCVTHHNTFFTKKAVYSHKTEKVSDCMKLNSSYQFRGRRQLGSGERMMEGDIVVGQRDITGSAGLLLTNCFIFLRPHSGKS